MKNSNKTAAPVIAALFFIAILGGCFSPWDGSEGKGTVVINLGNSNIRAIVDSDEQALLDYTIILTSPGKETVTKTLLGGNTSAAITVPVGNWDLQVWAVGETPEVYQQEEDGAESKLFGEKMVRGLGEASVEVKAGAATPVPITMTIATEVKDWPQLFRAFKKANVASETEYKKEYVIITEDIYLNAAYLDEDHLFVSLGVTSGQQFQHIVLRAKKDVVIERGDYSACLFTIASEGVTLELGGKGSGTITIKGSNSSQNDSLVGVSGGEFIMHDGVTLKDNSTNQPGGAVYVNSGGSFTMNGGTISGNSAQKGGGVYVATGGTFIKTGGTISGNTASETSGLGHAVCYDSTTRFYRDADLDCEDELSTDNTNKGWNQ